MTSSNFTNQRRDDNAGSNGRPASKGIGAHGRHPEPDAESTPLQKAASFISGLKPGKSAKASHGKRQRAKQAASTGVAAAGQAVNIAQELGIWLFSNKVATIIAGVVLVLALGGFVDGVAHWDKAYDNVSVNGTSVGGMTKEQIVSLVEESVGNDAANTKVTITLPKEYVGDAPRSAKSADPEDGEASESADEQSGDAAAEDDGLDEDGSVKSTWETNLYELGGSVPAETIADEALSMGRKADGGPFQRFGLFFSSQDIPVYVDLPDESVEELSSKIDNSIGQERVDANVYVNEGHAEIVPGKDGKAVDREELASGLKDAFLSGEASRSLSAPVIDAHSRITTEQAQEACDSVNRVIASGATFTYNGKTYDVKPNELGDWTYFETVEDGDGYRLRIYIDPDVASKAIVKGLDANIKSDAIKVTFEGTGENITVRAEGDTSIPEIGDAISELDAALYGENGRIWSSAEAKDPLKVEVTASTAPDNLTVEEAANLGIITVIGEYTTEFSNREGTENRNHNIKLVADILDGSVVKANGGIWSFNEQSGDTTKDPPFASAGSIVDGRHVDSIGGGICQVATTVFNAVYEAGLDVVERHNHSYYISNYPTGRDVGVSYGEMEFKWKNQLSSDVLLKMSHTDTSVTAKIYGVYTGYTVTSNVSEWQEGAKYVTQFVEDDSLPSGSSYVEEEGEDGSSITVTRIIKDAKGQIISEQTFDSVYMAQNEIIVIGPGTDTTGMARVIEESTTSERESESTSEDNMSESGLGGSSQYYADSDGMGGTAYPYDDENGLESDPYGISEDEYDPYGTEDGLDPYGTEDGLDPYADPYSDPYSDLDSELDTGYGSELDQDIYGYDEAYEYDSSDMGYDGYDGV